MQFSLFFDHQPTYFYVLEIILLILTSLCWKIRFRDFLWSHTNLSFSSVWEICSELRGWFQQTHQKSFGDPNQVKGMRAAATINIQLQIFRSAPTCNINDLKHSAIKTINTHPAPYSVKQIQTVHKILPHLPTAFSPMGWKEMVV